MPIRINLLAEAQALEDQRRRDPVKRVILAGAVLLGLILAWSSSLMVKTMIVKGEVSRLENSLNSRTNEYRQILETQKMLGQDTLKLEALHQLATNRFLLGNLLDALKRPPWIMSSCSGSKSISNMPRLKKPNQRRRTAARPSSRPRQPKESSSH
jgi:hypothetical protein